MLKKNKKIYIIKKQENNLVRTIKFLFDTEICICALSVYLSNIIKQTPNIFVLLLYTVFLCFICINTYFLIKLIFLYKIKNRYNIELKKIKLKYKKYLMHYKYNFSDNEYNKIYEYDSINKIIDVSKSSGRKIYFFEVTPGEKCFFLLEAYDNLYKYILSK